MIEFISEKDNKEKIAGTVLADLPEWFGLPESREEYITESREMPFWAALENGKAAGFLACKRTSPYTAEIYVMGILKKYHRKGIGRQLFDAFHSYAKEYGYLFLQVKTVEEGHYQEYDRTGAFYKSLGFRELECFPTLWDPWNPCQIFVRAV